jgi:hypothetical protein
MHRLHILVLGIIAVLVIGSAAIVFGESEEEMVVPMGTIILGPPESVEARRSNVEFPHAIHFGFDCKTCHHKWEGPELIQGCMTSGCHDVAVSPVKAGKGSVPKAESIKYYKAAYHQMCIGCHKEIKRQNKALEMSLKKLPSELPASGPTGCWECHPKE